MDASIRLGRIGGEEVGLHWSLLIAFWLIAWSLASVIFPQQIPGQGGGAYWVAAIVAALLFLASLLAHELGHALVARRLGMTVEGITLWLFGGVAQLRGEAVSARGEAQIAAVGPAISLVTGVVFGAIAVALGIAGAPSLAAVTAAWLGLMNAALAVFNLIPAFPLDGGRLLHAFLWQRRGDRLRATLSAAAAGRLFGYVLIAFGLLEFFAGRTISGLWSVFLGWFLLAAARGEESRVVLRGALRGVQVRDVMSPDPVIAPGWITVDEFINRFVLAHRFTTFPIRRFEGPLDGLVTLNRLKRVPPERRASTPVRDVACALSEVPTARSMEPLSDLLERMRGSTDGRALVLDDGKLVGIVSPADVTRALGIAALRGTSA